MVKGSACLNSGKPVRVYFQLRNVMDMKRGTCLVTSRRCSPPEPEVRSDRLQMKAVSRTSRWTLFKTNKMSESHLDCWFGKQYFAIGIDHDKPKEKGKRQPRILQNWVWVQNVSFLRNKHGWWQLNCWDTVLHQRHLFVCIFMFYIKTI